MHPLFSFSTIVKIQLVWGGNTSNIFGFKPIFDRDTYLNYLCKFFSNNQHYPIIILWLLNAYEHFNSVLLIHGWSDASGLLPQPIRIVTIAFSGFLLNSQRIAIKNDLHIVGESVDEFFRLCI